MRARLLVVAAVLALSGCGETDSEISAGAAEVLQADVTRVQAAATSGSAAQLAQAADKLRQDVSAQQAAGGLSDARAAAVLDQLARVLADVAAAPTLTPAATTPPARRSPAPPSPAPARETRGDEDKGEDEDKDDEQNKDGDRGKGSDKD